MGTYRMYTGQDGQCHWEEIVLSKHPQWTRGLEATRIGFREQAPGSRGGWHNAPQRQFVIILSGYLEIGFGDGTKRIFGPGDARLVEDTTGQGHTTTVHGDQPCITATVPLKEQ